MPPKKRSPSQVWRSAWRVIRTLKLLAFCRAGGVCPYGLRFFGSYPDLHCAVCRKPLAPSGAQEAPVLLRRSCLARKKLLQRRSALSTSLCKPNPSWVYSASLPSAFLRGLLCRRKSDERSSFSVDNVDKLRQTSCHRAPPTFFGARQNATSLPCCCS